jgi:predicted metal-dependent enzyme (double-stranded beta helix superfamily)
VPRDAVNEDPTHKVVSSVINRAFREPSDITRALGEPTESGLFPIYHSSDLTVVNVVWKPGMTLMPHNHQMWAVIGIYGGREDNIFWRRIKGDRKGRIEAAGARALSTGDTTCLGSDIIHSVNNPISKLTGAIHVYGGDFFCSRT